jgi:hypothetical protein
LVSFAVKLPYCLRHNRGNPVLPEPTGSVAGIEKGLHFFRMEVRKPVNFGIG